jgi:Secretion system C-terminal sorting domain
MKKNLLRLVLVAGVAITFSAKAQTINNAGFETWVDTAGFIPGSTISNPVGWIVSNFGLPTDPVTKSTDRHSGSFAVKIAIGSFMGTTMPGLLQAAMPTTQKAAYFNGYCKTSIIATDSFMLGVYYSNAGTGEMYSVAQMAAVSHANWTPFSIAISLPPTFTPDSVTIFGMISGSGATYGILDDLSFGSTSIGSAFGTSMTVPMAVNTIPSNLVAGSSIYPNPTNGPSEINFSLLASSNTTIKMFDISGRLVKIILNENLISGNHKIQINTDDMQNGIYFCTISGSGFSETKKFIVNK